MTVFEMESNSQQCVLTPPPFLPQLNSMAYPIPKGFLQATEHRLCFGDLPASGQVSQAFAQETQDRARAKVESSFKY